MTSTKARRSSGLRPPITRGSPDKPVPMLLARVRRATRAAAAEATSLGAFHADRSLKVGLEADVRRGRPSAFHIAGSARQLRAGRYRNHGRGWDRTSDPSRVKRV